MRWTVYDEYLSKRVLVLRQCWDRNINIKWITHRNIFRREIIRFTYREYYILNEWLFFTWIKLIFSSLEWSLANTAAKCLPNVSASQNVKKISLGCPSWRISHSFLNSLRLRITFVSGVCLVYFGWGQCFSVFFPLVILTDYDLHFIF